MSQAEPSTMAVPIPARASGVIDLDAIASPAVRMGLGYWRRLCEGRAYPSREQISPREIRGILRDICLVRVVDGGADYDYRIVGDGHVSAYGFSIQGRLLSQFEEPVPGHSAVLKRLYDRVLRKREPFAFRGWIEQGDDNAQYLYTESAFLPLGPDDGTIDHVLNFSTYTPSHY